MDFISLGKLALWQHPSSHPPQARVLLVHGIGEHSGRHINTIQFLTANGIEVVRFDLRGSGKSGGKRQHVDRFEEYVEDTGAVVNWIHLHCYSLPLFLLGHSLGGAIAIYYASSLGATLAGLILSAPAYLPGNVVSPIKVSVGRALVNLTPHVRISRLADHAALSRDQEVVKAYSDDPLCNHFSTLRQGNEILRSLPRIPQKCARIRLPVLIVHGSADRAIRLEGSYEILRSLQSSNKTLTILPGGYHEPHNDLGKEEYFALLSRWILNVALAESNG